MGNLLGAPVTEKETHVGESEDGLKFGVSSMQGWRIHMEDAHVAECRLYAAELEETAGATNGETKPKDGNSKTYKHIELPGHSIFAVFDGHGGTFAAQYSGRNLCRVLSRQPKFVKYAKFMEERAEKEKLLTKSRERVQYITTGLEYIEGALRDTFVELDMEIASALQGSRIPEADQPYHEEKPQGDGGGPAGMDTSGDPQQDALSEADSTLQLLDKEGDSGTTACVVVVAPQWVVCANAGDSRSVFSKHGHKAVPLSYDHKPDDEEEERRIRAAGGYVAGGRVEGDLAVSRGLGDFRFKNMATVLAGATGQKDKTSGDQMVEPEDQKVSPVPDVIIQNRSADKDEFIIVACDGIWDVQTNYEAVKSVAEMFEEGESNLGLICEEMCDTCLNMGSKDNMTTLVIKFEGQPVGNGGGVTARRQQRDSSQPNNDNQQQPS
ncbi:protein phosphatase 2C T23F11.1 [Seminavis robusta]|uniref:protein-serine/threonine phosphatase n=1 Tax=Seminavis robusta TaxID=568900 RepID=A0A9N8H7C5_9STRA|nr:protein phosphatase 2C T23F11.1 [Seminavis robusta]|eukprot:Sro174_g076800.1 protein phosphatase 2C T23F11.1 (438) ;mRNA; f:81180-82598